MQPATDHGLISGLADTDRAAAERLLAVCNQAENLDLPVEIEVDSAASTTDETAYFRYFERGSLVGLAWLPREPEPEACLMVHPDYRRRGVGRALLDAVRSEAGRRGLADFLVVCDEAAAAARPFILAAGGIDEGGEHRLALDPAAIDRSRPRFDDLQLRPVGLADLTTLVQLSAAAFERPLDESEDHIRRGLADPRRAYFIATLDGEPIGLLRLARWGDFADVTSFGVLAAHRGRGYGRQMLLDALDILLAEGWDRILIEVATENAPALGLYQSCGFRITTTYGFYRLGVPQLLPDQ